MGEIVGLNICLKIGFFKEEEEKNLKLFADFNLRMKMEKAVFNFLMETCFLPEEICGIDLVHWNKEVLHNSKCNGAAPPEETIWQLNQLPIQITHHWLQSKI